MPFYQYRCLAGHLTEKRGGLEEAETPCSVCAEPAKRRDFNLVVIVGALKEQKYPVSRYREASEEVDYHYTKAENDYGGPIKRPNLWEAAKREARKRDPKVRI